MNKLQQSAWNGNFHHSPLTNNILIEAVKSDLKPAVLLPWFYEKEAQKSGLYYTKSVNNIILAKTQGKVDEIIKIIKQLNDQHENLGIALGYPKTAVTAFSSRFKRKKWDNVPEKYNGFFAFSEEHYEEEIKVIDSWIENAEKKLAGEIQNVSH